MYRAGDVLDAKYRLVRSIGQGGMGEVFEAEHVQIGKRVAVKVLRQGAAKDDDVAARFTREARAAAAVGHECIVDVYDIGKTAEGTLYQVMELLAGESLGERIARRGALDQAFTAYVCCQVLSALDAAHRAGIVHRDLKPDNVFLVSGRQELPDVKLLDFGISKMLHPKDPEDRLTESGVVLGTPYYMAPEQAQGVSSIDHRVDIYAMGVILYESLTGKLPFQARSAYELISKILTEPVVPPSRRGIELPGPLEEVVLKALARLPEDRFLSASEMLEALLPFADEGATRRIVLPGPWVPPASGPETPPPRELAETGDASLATAKTLASKKSVAPRGRPGSAAAGEAPADRPALDEAAAARASAPTIMATAETPSRPAARGPATTMAILVVLALVVAAGVVLAVRGGGGAEAGSHAAEAGGRGDGGGAGGEGGARPAEPDTVEIRLDGVPETAAVRLDGATVTGTVLRIRRGTALRQVEVELEGRRPWRHMIDPSEDRTYVVELLPLGAPAPAEPDASANGPGRSGPGKGPGRRPDQGGGRGADGGARPAGGGLGLDTDFPSQGARRREDRDR